MTTRNWCWLGLVVLLGGIYVIFFTDWLRPTPIEVLPEIRAALPGRGGQPGAGVYPVSFALDDHYHLTSLKVVKVGATNIMWQLVPGTNSVPVKAIIYGRPVPGMKPANGHKRAEALEPGVPYELQIAAGRHHGKSVFQTKEVVPPVESPN